MCDTVSQLLDFSKAFDTINHKVLLQILKCPEAYNLMNFYLSNRSAVWNLVCEIGKDRFWDLYCFHKYIKLSSIHMYADNTQVYRSFHLNCMNQALVELEEDVESMAHISSME